MSMFKNRGAAGSSDVRFAKTAAALRRMFDERMVAAERGTQDGPAWLRFVPEGVRGVVSSSLPADVRDLFGRSSRRDKGPEARHHPATARSDAQPIAKGQFLLKSFSNSAGSRPYKLYIPSSYRGQPAPLIVMLHGCTQSPDDFAAGTGMNEAAEEHAFLVAYPGQTKDAHAQKCWNWFSPGDQQRGRGEPSLIAGITRQVMTEFAVDPRRVYIAGMSAGGAAAAIMVDAYPELYAAIGVHSGLACGSANDVASAFAAMKRGGQDRRTHSGSAKARRSVPTIVFHGDRDTTVSPRNGDDVMDQSVRGAKLREDTQTGRSAGGQDFTRTVHTDAGGSIVAEQWVIHGAGHAWSGGRIAGSYTDPRGPDATQEMLRFFKDHPQL